MILCLCAHMRSDHKAYYGAHKRGNGDVPCHVPGCGCEGYFREDKKMKPKKEDTVMRCIRITKKDIQASLNRKFGDDSPPLRGGRSRDVSATRRARK